MGISVHVVSNVYSWFDGIVVLSVWYAVTFSAAATADVEHYGDDVLLQSYIEQMKIKSNNIQP